MGWLGLRMRASASFQLQEITLYRLAHGGSGRGNVLHDVKREGEKSGGEISGGNVLRHVKRDRKMSGGKVSGEYV